MRSGIDVSAETVFAALSDAWVDCHRDLESRPWHRRHPANSGVSAAAGIGAEVAVARDGDVVRGIFETIDEAGRLIVRANDNRRIAITAGDVHFGATASVRN